MTAKLISGKEVAETIRKEIKAETEKLIAEKGLRPGLVTILVGENPASVSYVTGKQKAAKAGIDEEVRSQHGGLTGSCMVSDAFFPFRDGVDVGLREGVSAVIQPGGSDRDFESIEACNEAGAAMVFTGQRSFKH